MKSIAFLLVFIVATFYNCTVEDSLVSEEDPGYIKMDFANLQVGDKFYFQKFYGKDYRLGNPEDFIYEDKYLELEILEELAGNKFLFSEVIYSLKESEDEEVPIIISSFEVKADTLFNYFQVGNDSLKIILTDNDHGFKSNLFLSEYLSLKKHRSEEIDIIGWKTSHPFVEQNVELFTVGPKIRGLQYDTLNVYINNEPMQSDGAGITHIYDRNIGIVRSAYYGWAGGMGWDRIIDPF